MRKTIGICRNKTLAFAELRREHRFNKTIGIYTAGNRFSKQRLGGIREIELVQATETMKKPFIEDLSTVNTIEQPKPQWMAFHEQCQLLLRAVQDLRKEMLINQNKRLTCIKASEEKSFEMRIYDCAREATARIKKCQQLVQSIKNAALKEPPAHARVCNTVCFRLATDIQEATKQLRAQQKSFVEQRKHFEVTEKASFLELAADHVLMGSGMQELIEDQAMKDLEQRNEQIKKIVQSIYQLSDIYKDLSTLVVLQGSLLDRIDANIEASKEAVSRGLQHLVSAQKKQKKTSKCACGAILVLLVLNGIFLIVLCVRWFR